MNSASETPALTACAHCNDEVPVSQVIFKENLPFCCEGCLQVYSLLHTHGLNEYYQLPDRSSLKPIRRKNWSWLDTPEIAGEIYQFNDGQRARVRFILPGVHCASCIWLLEKLPHLNPGILRADADITTGSLDLLTDPRQIRLSELASILDMLGYPPEISGKKEAPVNRKWMIKLAVAGFSFGNVMLFSFPEYLGLPSDDEYFSLIFGGLNLIFSIPAFFYSGWGYIRSAYTALKHKSINVDVPLALGMVALFGVTVHDILLGFGPGYADSLTGLVFFLLIGKWYQDALFRKFRFERDYQHHLPMAACRIEDGRENYVPVGQLKKGDVLKIRTGEVIPADGRMRLGSAKLDYHMITGESAPVPVTCGERLFAGGEVLEGQFEMICNSDANRSYLAGLWKDSHFQGKVQHKFVRRIDRVAAWFIGVVLLISAGAFLYWLPEGSGNAFRVLASILIITCPCALALSVPFIFGNTARLLARKGWFLRNPDKIEEMAAVSVLAFDKTGTLTSSYGLAAIYRGEPVSEKDLPILAAMASASTHPLSRAIAETLREIPEPAQELPIRHIAGKGLELEYEGRMYRMGSASWLYAEETEKPTAGASLVYVEIDGKKPGYFYLENKFRDGLENMFRRIPGKYALHILSGDHEGEAPRLKELTQGRAGLHFRCGPDEKVKQIKAIEEKGKKVLFLGDGLNDTGALSAASVGLAVNDSGSGLLPPCDGMVAGEALNRLPMALGMCRSAMNLTRASLGISFFYNIIGLGFAVTGHMHPIVAAILMPASSISVVAFALISTYFSMKRHENTD